MATAPAPVQVGASTTASAVPIFYIPPPDEPVNVFASFMAAFTATRTPWAREVFSARLRAMDPNARAQALLAVQKLANELQLSAESTRRVQEQAAAGRFAQLVKLRGQERTLEAALVRADVDAQIANLQTTERSQARQTIRTQGAEQLLEQVSRTILTASSEFAAGNGAAARQALNQASTELRAGFVTVADKGEQLAISRRLRDLVSSTDASRVEGGGPGTAGALFQELAVGSLGLPEQGRDAPLPLAGVRQPATGASFAQQEIERALGEPALTRRTTTVGTRIRGPAGVAPPAAAGVLGEEPIVPVAAPPPAALPGPSGLDLLRQQIEESFEGQQELGGIGTPIFTKPDPRVRALQRFQERTGTAGLTDLILAGERAQEARRRPGGRALRRGLAEEQAERAVREGQLRAVGGAVAAPVGEPELERFIPRLTVEDLEVKPVIQGEDFEVTPRPSRKERRAERKAERAGEEAEAEGLRVGGEQLTDEQIEALIGSTGREEEEETEEEEEEDPLARFLPKRRRANG